MSKIIGNLGEIFEPQAQIFSLKMTKASQTKAKNRESGSDESWHPGHGASPGQVSVRSPEKSTSCAQEVNITCSGDNGLEKVATIQKHNGETTKNRVMKPCLGNKQKEQSHVLQKYYIFFKEINITFLAHTAQINKQ